MGALSYDGHESNRHNRANCYFMSFSFTYSRKSAENPPETRQPQIRHKNIRPAGYDIRRKIPLAGRIAVRNSAEVHVVVLQYAYSLFLYSSPEIATQCLRQRNLSAAKGNKKFCIRSWSGFPANANRLIIGPRPTPPLFYRNPSGSVPDPDSETLHSTASVMSSAALC